MKKLTLLLVMLVTITLTSCASYNPVETPTFDGPQINQERVDRRLEVVEDYRAEPAGFWRGVIHGAVSPFALLAIAFGNRDIGVYETYNTGNWYNFGFLLGCGALAGSSTSSSSKK